MHLLQTLNNISAEIISHVRYPNYGGCAVIASIVGRELSRYIEVEAVISDDDSNEEIFNHVRENFDTSEFSIHDWNYYNVEFNHIYLTFVIDGVRYIYDSDGVEEWSGDYYEYDLIGKMSIDEVLKLASSHEGWNPRFNRKQISIIGRIVHKQFFIPENKFDLIPANENYTDSLLSQK